MKQRSITDTDRLQEFTHSEQRGTDFPMAVYFALSFGPLIAITRDHVLGFITLDDKMIDDFVEACWVGIKAPEKH